MGDRAGRRGGRRNRIYRGRLNGGQGRKEGGRRNRIYRGRLNGGQGRKGWSRRNRIYRGRLNGGQGRKEGAGGTGYIGDALMGDRAGRRGEQEEQDI